jgi:sugar lactone lactonase YvrE
MEVRVVITAVRPEFQQIIGLETPVEKIASGFQFTEGPVWSARAGALTFSDIPGDTLYQWRPGHEAEVLRRPSANTNGNTFDRQGRLLTCEHSGRRVSRTAAGGSVETLVDSYQAKRLNSPNDVICAANGDIYFTDPPYGLRRPDGSFEESEIGFNGVFRLSAATGVLTLLADDFVRPNGLALSGDERRLFVADTQEAHVRVFDITAGGSLANGRVFTETVHEGATGRCDGIKLDSRGNLYVATNLPSGVWVYDTEGRMLGIIGVGEGPANLAFGGDGWRSLFVTAQTSVYRVELKVAGQPVGV